MISGFLPAPAEQPRMLFLGVTTGHSGIHRIFPRWAAALGIPDAVLTGVDLPPDAPPECYAAFGRFLRDDPLTRGALVTTHKLGVFAACQRLFDRIDPLAADLREVSSLAKTPDGLHARTVDPHVCGAALDEVLPAGHWRTGAEALILGAGGAGVALAWQLACARPVAEPHDFPIALHVTDVSAERLVHLAERHAAWRSPVPLHTHCLRGPDETAALLAARPPHSLVVNASGLGKDRPGSPLPDGALFPRHGVAWELNYRGERLFLQQARAQAAARQLIVADGYRYFLRGWLEVIADVFGLTLPGPDGMARLYAMAGEP